MTQTNNVPLFQNLVSLQCPVYIAPEWKKDRNGNDYVEFGTGFSVALYTKEYTKERTKDDWGKLWCSVRIYDEAADRFMDEGIEKGDIVLVTGYLRFSTDVNNETRATLFVSNRGLYELHGLGDINYPLAILVESRGLREEQPRQTEKSQQRGRPEQAPRESREQPTRSQPSEQRTADRSAPRDGRTRPSSNNRTATQQSRPVQTRTAKAAAGSFEWGDDD